MNYGPIVWDSVTYAAIAAVAITALWVYAARRAAARRSWSAGVSSEDPDRRETVYSLDLRNGCRIDVTWHDGDLEKWHWFLFDRNGEPTAASDRIFPDPDAAMSSAERYARSL